MNPNDLAAEGLDLFFFLEKHRGSGLPAPLFYVANAEPAQSARLFQPVRSSHGSLRRLPYARCGSNEARNIKMLKKGLNSMTNEWLYENGLFFFYTNNRIRFVVTPERFF
ncbi:hypothetical protein B1B05_16430 [Domibacillus enclensis]|uniref:Uncharacterized protein n=1 Tax=Domibacillus enclensis TaxID=1017273 RepID=A0ABX4E5S4_9BACI|nr:hypothetical protein B1B05_16430 [Domibacillus enclensis]